MAGGASVSWVEPWHDTVGQEPHGGQEHENREGGETKTDAINKALQVYAFIQQQLDSGGALYVKDAGSDQAERLRIF